MSPTLCVAYAGAADAALDALAQAAAIAPYFDEVLASLTDRSRGAGPQVPEFMVVSSAPARIARIRSGIIEDQMSVASIGDVEGLDEFQRISAISPAIHGVGIPPESLLTAQLVREFSELVRRS